MRDESEYMVVAKKYAVEAKLAMMLELYGEQLAEKEGWRDLSGMEAIHLYVMNKHHWPLEQIRTMSTNHLRDVLAVEMQGWTLPAQHPARIGLSTL